MARARLSLCLEVSRAQPRGPLPGGALLAPWPWGAFRPLTRPTLGSCCLAARLCPHRSPGRAGARGRGGRALQETAGRATTSACVCLRTQVSLRIELGMQSLICSSFSIGVARGRARRCGELLKRRAFCFREPSYLRAFVGMPSAVFPYTVVLFPSWTRWCFSKRSVCGGRCVPLSGQPCTAVLAPGLSAGASVDLFCFLPASH